MHLKIRGKSNHKSGPLNNLIPTEFAVLISILKNLPITAETTVGNIIQKTVINNDIIQTNLITLNKSFIVPTFLFINHNNNIKHKQAYEDTDAVNINANTNKAISLFEVFNLENLNGIVFINNTNPIKYAQCAGSVKKICGLTKPMVLL